jgi:hypothetical protein
LLEACWIIFVTSLGYPVHVGLSESLSAESAEPHHPVDHDDQKLTLTPLCWPPQKSTKTLKKTITLCTIIVLVIDF